MAFHASICCPRNSQKRRHDYPARRFRPQGLGLDGQGRHAPNSQVEFSFWLSETCASRSSPQGRDPQGLGEPRWMRRVERGRQRRRAKDLKPTLWRKPREVVVSELYPVGPRHEGKRSKSFGLPQKISAVRHSHLSAHIFSSVTTSAAYCLEGKTFCDVNSICPPDGSTPPDSKRLFGSQANHMGAKRLRLRSGFRPDAKSWSTQQFGFFRWQTNCPRRLVVCGWSSMRAKTEQWAT